jgi:hypothetical protein
MGCSLFVIRYSLFVIRYSLFVKASLSVSYQLKARGSLRVVYFISATSALNKENCRAGQKIVRVFAATKASSSEGYLMRLLATA